MTEKTIPLTMPDWVWGRLVMIAAKQDITVGQLLAKTIQEAIDASPLVVPFRNVAGKKSKPTIEDLIAKAADARDPAAVLALEVRAAREDGWRAPKYEQRARSKAKEAK